MASTRSQDSTTAACSSITFCRGGKTILLHAVNNLQSDVRCRGSENNCNEWLESSFFIPLGIFRFWVTVFGPGLLRDKRITNWCFLVQIRDCTYMYMYMYRGVLQDNQIYEKRQKLSFALYCVIRHDVCNNCSRSHRLSWVTVVGYKWDYSSSRNSIYGHHFPYSTTALRYEPPLRIEIL